MIADLLPGIHYTSIVFVDLLGKKDSIVFCPLTDLQFKIYQRVLELPEFKALIKFATERSESAKRYAEGVQQRKQMREDLKAGIVRSAGKYSGNPRED